jgi:DNA-binding transcriptional ArsR family regulator
VRAIEALRRLRMTAAEIAECLEMALSTVSRWLRRIGLGKLSRLQPPEPANRYQRSRPVPAPGQAVSGAGDAPELLDVDVDRLPR